MPLDKMDPRVYVACLACYNAGKHHGEWFDADDCLIDAVQEHFQANEAGMLACGGEELLCHDVEGFEPYSPGEVGVSEAQALGEAFRKHGIPLAAFMSNENGLDVDDAIAKLEDCYQGEAKSEEDFAEDLAEDMGDLANVPDFIKSHIDWEGVARDLFCGDFYSVEHDGTVYIFRNQ